MRRFCSIFALLACLLLIPAAHAANCSIGAASVAFGTYDPLSNQPLNATGSLSISCNSDNTVTIELSAGSGTFAQRQMIGPSGGTLKYNLYTDINHINIWGNNSNYSTLTANVGRGGTTIPIYAQINPPGQMSPIGSYTDTITITITYNSGQGTKVTTSTQFNPLVTANIISGCSISAVGTMNFGSLGVSFLTIDKTGVTASITYTCSTGLNATITLGQGLSPAGGSSDAAPLRQMRLGATSNYISYNLYTSNSYGTVWGNTAATGLATTGTGTGQIATVYGKATHANVPTGSYSDTVVVTISF